LFFHRNKEDQAGVFRRRSGPGGEPVVVVVMMMLPLLRNRPGRDLATTRPDPVGQRLWSYADDKS
jgi:hypothetical protein